MPINFFGLRYPDDDNSFATGTMMLGTQSKINFDKSKGNTFIGLGSGNVDIAGETGQNGCVDNTFIGTGSGHNTYSDITKPEWYSCYNTFIGRSSGMMNETGFNNTYVGAYSGKNNTTGINNVFIGTDTGYNSKGDSNIFVGALSGYNTDTSNNICIGTETIEHFNSNYGNIVIGNSAKCNNETDGNILIGNYSQIKENVVNSISIGVNNEVSKSNAIYLGNEKTKIITASVNISVDCDNKKITDISDECQGIDFINSLHPVVYSTTNGLTEGLIGQEIHQVIEENNIKSFNGLNIPINEEDLYSINYASFIPSLIKSIQQLSNEVNQLKDEIKILKSELSSEDMLEKIEDSVKSKGRKRR
jgi:hypothetical protein